MRKADKSNGKRRRHPVRMTGMMDHVTLNKVVSKGKRDEPRAEGDDSVGKEL